MKHTRFCRTYLAYKGFAARQNLARPSRRRVGRFSPQTGVVTRVAVPLENDDGERSHAATSVTMMTLSGQSDDSTRLGFNVAWVPTYCIHAKRSDDGSLRTWEE